LKQILKSTMVATAVVFCSTFLADALIDQLSHKYHTPHHLDSLFVSLLVGTMFFLNRYHNKHYFTRLIAYESTRKKRRHLMANSLQTIAMSCTDCKMNASRRVVQEEVEVIKRLLDDPILPPNLMREGWVLEMEKHDKDTPFST
jgi:hypothetical protein